MTGGRGTTLLVVGAVCGLLAGCGQSPQDEAHDLLQDRLDGVHEGYLTQRAYHPTSRGEQVLAELDRYDDALETSVGDDEVSLVIAVGVTVTFQEMFSTTEEYSLGACLRITIRPGSGEGDRGSVRTEPVDCPRGAEVEGYWGNRADAVTTDLDGREDDVGPEPYDPEPCRSGEDCTSGGG